MKDLAYISGAFTGMGGIGIVCAAHYDWGIGIGIATVMLLAIGIALSFFAKEEQARG